MEWRRLKIALFSSVYMLAIVWLVFFIQTQFSSNLDELGIMPRELKSLPSFLFSPFLHANIEHLTNNSIAFFILSVTCFYFYGGVALSVILSGIASGLLVWVFGRDAIHIGLSGVCYCLSSFLFFSGIIRRNASLMAISLLVIFWQSSLIWGMIPSLNEPLNISWESHVAGVFVGFFMAFIYRTKGPVNEVELSDDEDEEDGDDSLSDDGENMNDNRDKE